MNFLELLNQQSGDERKSVLLQDKSNLELKKIDLEDQIKDIDNAIRTIDEELNTYNTVSLSFVLSNSNLWMDYGILSVFDSPNGKQVAYMDGVETKIYTVPSEMLNSVNETEIKKESETIITNTLSSPIVKHTILTMPTEENEPIIDNQDEVDLVKPFEDTKDNIENNNLSSSEKEVSDIEEPPSSSIVGPTTPSVPTFAEYYEEQYENTNTNETIKEDNADDKESNDTPITSSDIDNLIVGIEDYLKYDLELDEDNNYLDDVDYSLIEEEIFNDFDTRIAGFNDLLSNLAARSVIKDIRIASFYQSKTIRVYVSPLVDKSRPGVSVPVCVAISDGKEWQIYCSYENEGNIQNIKTNIKLAVKNKYGETSNADLLVCGRFLDTGFDAIVNISSDDFRCKELSTKYPTGSGEALVTFDYGCNKDNNAINKVTALKLDEKLYCIIIKEKDIRTKIISEEQSMETVFRRDEKTFSMHLYNNNLVAEYQEMQTVYIQKEDFR